MCIIIYAKDGHIPKSHLEESLTSNPHGWGFMTAENGKVIVERGMTRKQFRGEWPKRPLGPVVFHARITSHGETNMDNCHPFPVPGHGLYMAHNGIIRRHADEKSSISDTRHFINDLLQYLPRKFLQNTAIRTMIEDYIGWSKLAFMDNDGRVSILNASLGHWVGNRWYSNLSYICPAAPVVISPPSVVATPQTTLFPDGYRFREGSCGLTGELRFTERPANRYSDAGFADE